MHISDVLDASGIFTLPITNQFQVVHNVLKTFLILK